MRPALGALLFALGNSQQESLRLPESSTMQRVYEEQRRSEFTGDLAHG